MKYLNSSYSMYPVPFLSNLLKRGSTCSGATGSSNFFIIRSSSKAEMNPFLFQSNSWNSFLIKNSSLVPLLFWINLNLKDFIKNLRVYSLDSLHFSPLYPQRCPTYFMKGSSCEKFTLRSSKNATNYSFTRFPSGIGSREIKFCWHCSIDIFPVLTSSIQQGLK